MKRIFITLALFFPTFCGATQTPLEFELIRTPETPGFFAVTLFPSKDAEPIQKPIVFVKNFHAYESKIYTPIVNFLTELGATVTETPSTHKNARVISIGSPLPNSENFSSSDAKKSLEQFEAFSLQKLKPVFFKNLKAEFGGNISDVLQSNNAPLDEKGITFIGKFNKDMRTRMAIVADNGTGPVQFEAPLDLPDKNLSLTPVAEALPQLWEQLHQKERASEQPLLSLFPWIMGGIGIMLLFFVLLLHRRNRDRTAREDETLQAEFPWHTVSAKEDKPSSPPFDIY